MAADHLFNNLLAPPFSFLGNLTNTMNFIIRLYDSSPFMQQHPELTIDICVVLIIELIWSSSFFLAH